MAVPTLTHLTFRLPLVERDRLLAEAVRRERSVSEEIREAIREHLAATTPDPERQAA